MMSTMIPIPPIPIPTPFPYPVWQGTPLHGNLRLDMRLPAATRSPQVRKILQNKFIERLEQLVLLEEQEHRAAVAEFLMWEATCHPDHIADRSHESHLDPDDNPRFMPDDPNAQERRLNEVYLAGLCAKCEEVTGGANPPLEQCVATLAHGGLEYYCIGPGGLRFCYHDFTLVDKTSGNPLPPIAFGDHTAEIVIVCSGVERPIPQNK